MIQGGGFEKFHANNPFISSSLPMEAAISEGEQPVFHLEKLKEISSFHNVTQAISMLCKRKEVYSINTFNFKVNQFSSQTTEFKKKKRTVLFTVWS